MCHTKFTSPVNTRCQIPLMNWKLPTQDLWLRLRNNHVASTLPVFCFTNTIFGFAGKSYIFFVAQAPSLTFLRLCEIHYITKYDKLLKLLKYYPLKYSNESLTLMSILQATHNYSITHNFIETFRTRSKQIQVES